MEGLGNLLIIAVSAAVVNNVVLSQFLGLCPFFGVSKKIETAAGMGGAVIFVITLSSFVTISWARRCLTRRAMWFTDLPQQQVLRFLLF